MLDSYLTMFPEDEAMLRLLQSQIEGDEDLIYRKNFNGHVTASGLVFSPDLSKVLLIFHNKLGRFLQPGGHVETCDDNLIESATREVLEETGLDNIVLHEWCLKNNSPIYIDTHSIPENFKKNELEHFHHDFMFLFKCSKDLVSLQLEEVSGFKWVNILDFEDYDSLVGRSIRRMKKMKII